MKGYWIGRVDVSNPDAYQNYVKANAVPFAKYGARFLVRGGTYRVLIGVPDGAPSQRFNVTTTLR